MQNKAIHVNRADVESFMGLDIGVRLCGVGAVQARDGDMWESRRGSFATPIHTRVVTTLVCGWLSSWQGVTPTHKTRAFTPLPK
jgi:hypothetical protein